MPDIPSPAALFEQTRQRLIQEGLASVHEHESGAKRRGALRGFRICQGLRSLDDFERELTELRRAEFFLSDAATSGYITSERYWEHHYITLQVEFVYERLRVLTLLLGERV